MERMTKVSASQLNLGDRFYKLTDKSKRALQMIAPKYGDLMYCPVEFINTDVENKKSTPIKANTAVVYLRNVNN